MHITNVGSIGFAPLRPTANFPYETVAQAPQAQPDVDRYYAAAQGKQGAALLSALHDIVSNGQIAHTYSEASASCSPRSTIPTATTACRTWRPPPSAARSATIATATARA